MDKIVKADAYRGRQAASATMYILKNFLHMYKDVAGGFQKHCSWEIAHTKNCILKSDQ